jgi:hypothetical protein
MWKGQEAEKVVETWDPAEGRHMLTAGPVVANNMELVASTMQATDINLAWSCTCEFLRRHLAWFCLTSLSPVLLPSITESRIAALVTL